MKPVRAARLAIALPVALASLLIAGAGSALADCMMPPPIDQAVQTAEIVFVGTVTSTTNRNSWARVEVEEVWRGPDQPATVVLKGGPDGNVATSADRSFEVGMRYLFVPYADPSGGMSDNSCSSTTPWSGRLLALRPAEVRRPTAATPGPSGFDPSSLAGPAAVALVVAGALLVVGLLARGRQSA